MSALTDRELALKQALRAATAQIEPGPDGLERIQARLRTPLPLPLAWADAVRTDIVLAAPVAWQAVRQQISAILRWLSRTLRPMLAQAWRAAADRFGPPRRSASHAAPTTLGWLRPIAAFVTVVFIVAAGTYVALDAAGVISPGGNTNANLVQPGGSGQASHPGGGSEAVKSRSVLPTGTAGNPTASPSESCSPSTSPKASGSSTPPIDSLTPSTSSPPSPSPSPSVTPSPGDSSSAAAGADAGTGTEQAGASTSSAHATTLQVATLTAKASTSPCGKKKKKTTTHNTTVSAAGEFAVTIAAEPAARLQGQ